MASGSVAVVPPDALPQVTMPSPVIKTEPREASFLFQGNRADSPVLDLPEEEYLGPIEQDTQEFGHNDLIAAINGWARQSEQRRSQSHVHGAAAVRQIADLSTRVRSRGRSRSPVRSSIAASENSMFFSDRPSSSSAVELAIREPSLSSSASSSGSADPVIKKEDNTDQCRRCKCPVSYECTARGVYNLDCRCMVGEWEGWGYRTDQEAFDR